MATEPPPPSPTPTPTSMPSPTWVPTLTAPPPKPTATPDTELLATMDKIEVEVAFMRGLEETSPITRTLLTPEELAAYLEAEFAEAYTPEEVESDTRVLAAFDFVPSDFDLLALLLDLYSTEVVGLYDDEEDTLYVVTDAGGGELDPLARITFAHEFTHSLQDEYFDLETFADGDQLNDDELLARMSLVEGDASLVMTQYMMVHLREFSSEDLAALQGEEAQEGLDALQTAPAIIRETFLFPYIRGLEFVALLQDEGWEAVDAAFADPPQSTEQILHPDRYFDRDEPQVVALPPLTDTLGTGWRLVEEETLGEFQTGLYLAQQVDEAMATRAAAGWDGDRYALYVHDGADLLVFATAWDSTEDREEFVAAYSAYAEGKYGEAATRSGEAEAWWEAPEQIAILLWDDKVAWIVLGPDAVTVERVLAALER